MIVTNLQRPSEEQMKMFMEFSDDAPIKMVNLLKFKIKAEYSDGRSSDLSGKEAYAIYAEDCLLYTSPSPRDGLLSRMPSSA